jgi:hypothetical protein
MAERVGFEPTVEFPRHSLSRRAPSTARTPLRGSSLILAEPRLLGNAGLLGGCGLRGRQGYGFRVACMRNGKKAGTRLRYAS